MCGWERNIVVLCKRWSWLDSISYMRKQGRVQDNEQGNRSPPFVSIAGWTAMAVLVGISKSGRGFLDRGGWCLYAASFRSSIVFFSASPVSPRLLRLSTRCTVSEDLQQAFQHQAAFKYWIQRRIWRPWLLPGHPADPLWGPQPQKASGLSGDYAELFARMVLEAVFRGSEVRIRSHPRSVLFHSVNTCSSL